MGKAVITLLFQPMRLAVYILARSSYRFFKITGSSWSSNFASHFVTSAEFTDAVIDAVSKSIETVVMFAIQNLFFYKTP